MSGTTERFERRNVLKAIGGVAGLTTVSAGVSSADDPVVRTLDVDTSQFDGLDDGSITVYESGRVVERLSGTLGAHEDNRAYRYSVEDLRDARGALVPDQATARLERVDAWSNGEGQTSQQSNDVSTSGHSGSDDEGDFEGAIEMEGWNCWYCNWQVQSSQSIDWTIGIDACNVVGVETGDSWAYSNDTKYDWEHTYSSYDQTGTDTRDEDEFTSQWDTESYMHLQTYLTGECNGDLSWDTVFDKSTADFDHKIKVYSDAIHV